MASIGGTGCPSTAQPAADFRSIYAQSAGSLHAGMARPGRPGFLVPYEKYSTAPVHQGCMLAGERLILNQNICNTGLPADDKCRALRYILRA